MESLEINHKSFFSLYNFKISSKITAYIIAILCVFGFIIRFTAAGYTVHAFDMNYYFDWATGLQDGFFNAYEHVNRLDYPPVLLFFLYPIGKFIDPVWEENSMVIMMTLLKLIQIITDTLLIPAIYLCLKQYSQIVALSMSVIWAINPAAIFNSAFWGQTDSLMMLLLLISFTLLDLKRPVAATLLFALSCLTKFQCVYFAPVFLLFLFFSKYTLKQLIQSVAAGAGLAVLVFLPFMLQSGITLPFEIYFGGHGKYPYAVLNAFNIYGMLKMNYVRDDLSSGGWITLNAVSMLVLVLIVMLIVYLYFKSSNKCPWILCFLIMQCIFMLTTRMHERYQIPVLIFAMVACIKHKDKKLFICYLALIIMTYLNQYILFTKAAYPYNAPWLNYYNTILAVLSFVNVCLFIYSCYVSMKILFEPFNLTEKNTSMADNK